MVFRGETGGKGGPITKPRPPRTSSKGEAKYKRCNFLQKTERVTEKHTPMCGEKGRELNENTLPQLKLPGKKIRVAKTQN